MTDQTTKEPTPLSPPVEFHTLPRKMQQRLSHIVDRVVVSAVARGMGSELMERVYLSGLYHGMKLGAEMKDT